MSEPIAFIGSQDTVAGFAPLGVRTFAVSDRLSSVVALRTCLEAKAAIVFVTEVVAETLEDELQALRFKPTPAILVVPSVAGSQGLGLRRLRSLVEKAVGADILSRDNPQDKGRESS